MGRSVVALMIPSAGIKPRDPPWFLLPREGRVPGAMVGSSCSAARRACTLRGQTMLDHAARVRDSLQIRTLCFVSSKSLIVPNMRAAIPGSAACALPT